MKITELRIDILEMEPIYPIARSNGNMTEIPDLLWPRFVGGPPKSPEIREEEPRTSYSSLLRIQTDSGIETCDIFGNGWIREAVEWEARNFKVRMAPELVGLNAFDREYIWHKLWYAQRFMYISPSWVSLIDTLLWDLAGLYAKMPLHKMLGACRDKVPCYITAMALAPGPALGAKEAGFFGYKDHSYLGPKKNIEAAKATREAVGDDFFLMHDPVEQYTYNEAVRVGRALEELNFLWMEEPLQDYDLMGLKKLCDTLDLPILALEFMGAVGGEPYIAAPYLALGAVDIVRQRGIGITGQIKTAHLAEAFGAKVHGGSPHVVAAISNDPFFETGGPKKPPEKGIIRDMTVIGEDGYMYVPQGPGLGREIDWNEIEERRVGTI